MDRLEKINELRRILKELRLRGAALRKNFSAFEQFINQEKFPESKLLDELNDDFLGWIRGANKSFEIYGKLFEGVKPRTFAEIERNLNAEEKRIIVANTFAQAERFLQLVAKNADVKNSLEKYQSKFSPKNLATTRLKKKSRFMQSSSRRLKKKMPARNLHSPKP